MPETEVSLKELQQEITHLKDFSENGWVLNWGEGAQEQFQLICKGANSVQVKRIDDLISRAYQKLQV